MLLVSMKTYLALLWGISALFSEGSMSDSIPETSDINSTADPNKATKQLIGAHEAHNETETETLHPIYKPAEVSAAAETAVPPTVENEEAVTYSSDSSSDGTTGLVAMNAAATTASSSGLRLHTVTTGGGEAQPSPNMTISETAKPTEEQLHQLSPTTSTGMTSSSATTSAASLAKETVSSPQPTSTTEPEGPSSFSTTTSPADSTQSPVFIQNLSSPSASTASTMRGNPTSEAAPVSEPTSSPVTTSETSTNNTELSSTSQPVSVTTNPISTSHFTDAGGSSSTAEPISFSATSANTTAAAVSTSPTGIFIHHVTKRLLIPTTKSTPATTKASKSPPSTEVQPCSTRGVMKHCLIAIASLAGLATIFMVTTIILCTKLSARKYKIKKPQQATEMMCISSLLPERNYNYTRQRNPVPNGVLVIHSNEDSDEDGGDNFTLSSFLPDNDRFV